MKKFLIGFGIFIVVIIAALAILPNLFKDKILNLIEDTSKEYIDADLKIGDVSFSMFRHFPNLGVKINDVTIAGKNQFSNDTVINLSEFDAAVNLMSLIGGDEYVIKKIIIRNCSLKAVIDTTGKANWDIMKSDDTDSSDVAEEANSDESSKGIKVKRLLVENLKLEYNDYQSNMFAKVEDTDLDFSGNLSEENTNLKYILNMSKISYTQGGSTLLNNFDLNWTADIAANFKDMLFTIAKSDMTLNALKIDVNGNVQVLGDNYNVDITAKAPTTQFADLLALVPKDYEKYIKGVKTTGGFNLEISAKGLYAGDTLPALDAKFIIDNASLQYPELPESIKAINMDLRVMSPGGPLDSIVADLSKLSFSVANNPFSVRAKVANLNNPSINAEAKGVINFASLKNALPLDSMSLAGTLTADVALNGLYSYIEKEEYEKFAANGQISVKDVVFKNSDFPKGIMMPTGVVTISPSKLNMSKFKAIINSSDFELEGFLSNYLPYIFKDKTLGGSFTLNSSFINLNEFMGDETSSETQSVTDSVTTISTDADVIAIPKNLNVKLATNISKVLFDSLTINNIKGNITLNNGIADMSNLTMNMLQGNMTMSGSYNTSSPKTPKVNLNLNINNFELGEAYSQLSMIKESIPFAMSCSGKFSSVIKFASQLDSEMSPIMKTANGSGYISSQGLLIKDNKAMNQLAGILNNTELSRISVSNLKIDFTIVNGDITIAPFKTKLAGNDMNMYGTQTAEGKMNYTMSMDVKKSMLGDKISSAINSIPGASNLSTIPVGINITGTLDKPIITPDVASIAKSLAGEATKSIIGDVLGKTTGDTTATQNIGKAVEGLKNLFKKKK